MKSIRQITTGWPARLRLAYQRRREQQRVRALQRLEQDFLPPLLEIQDIPPSPHKRLVLWSLLLLLLIALLWSYFGHINVVATAGGRFIPDGRLQVVQPLQIGVVKAIRVKVGEQVKAGDTLIELDTEPLEASEIAVQKNIVQNEFRQRRLREQLAGHKPDPSTADESDATQRNLWRAEMDAYHSQLRIAKASTQEAAAELAAGAALLSHKEHSVNIADEQVANSKILAEMGAIARNEYLQAERDRLGQHGELESLREKQETLRAHLTSARETLARLESERRLRLLEQMENTQQQGYALEESRSKVSHELAAQRLRAPVDGIVQAVNVASLGEVVSPKQDVVTIVPELAPLIVEIRVANQDAGFVKVGQSVEIKVDAFPFMQYGILPGRLTWISPDAESDAKQGLYYRAWIESEQTFLSYAGKKMQMRPGMSASVDVKTGERRIIDFFLSPLLKNLSESLSIR
ncbi:HlyD family type I secretion periplasmic adaptor subunit [Quatrionicoccus australiensis]|uniref:HlyD family type I secretion periplasmic adaptor subunit n=1 Tax=Quatrionicoccus australiensis TaxID=138118 RepID=UPI001CF8B7B6|nr:HlyD family type I secretion periplasmic adaptor subunit [Quatrionicoccus australiensis]UCV13838.1 HlyD family type I secretion periplasmic adaptor subunit [Quatrionicoccus australiensis]